MTPAAIAITAGGNIIATVTIAVPADAAPGEQYAVVWAEARSSVVGGGVVQVSRVGIRIYLSVGLGGPPAANFTIGSLTAARSSSGQPIVLASVHNTGGRALDMSGTLQLADGPGGLRAGPFAARLGTALGIGDTEPVTIALNKQLPNGPWNAQVTLASGLIQHEASATLTFPATGTSLAVSTSTRHSSVWPLFATVATALGLLLAAVLWMIMDRRRRRGHHGHEHRGRSLRAAPTVR